MATLVGLALGCGLLYVWLTGRWFGAVLVALGGMALAKGEAPSTQALLYVAPWVPLTIRVGLRG